MALLCPVGHPPGVATSYCRLCGRDYVEVPDEPTVAVPEAVPNAVPDAAAAPVPDFVPAAVPAAPPAPAAAVMTPPPAPPLAAVLSMPPAAVPLPPVPGSPVPDVLVPPPAAVETGHVGRHVQLPLVHAPAVEEESAPEEVPSAVRAVVDRTQLLAAGGAGLLGGVVASVAVHSLLG